MGDRSRSRSRDGPKDVASAAKAGNSHSVPLGSAVGHLVFFAYLMYVMVEVKVPNLCCTVVYI